MFVTAAPSSQPTAVCTGDQDCRTLNARCYPGLPHDAVPPSQIPLNNSLHCYCNLMFQWIGPECSELSWQSIVMGVSNIIIGVIALILAVAIVMDIVRFRRYSSRQVRKSWPFKASFRRPLGRAGRAAKATRTQKSAASSNLNCLCLDSQARNRLDMYMVTSILLFVALITWSILAFTGTAQIWTMMTCAGPDGARHSCLLVAFSVFLCVAPMLGISLVFLLSVFIYNASFRATGLSSLPCASIWTLMLLDTALTSVLIATSALDNLAIASYAGALFVLLAGIINLLTCYRLRDLSFFRLVLRRGSCGRLCTVSEDRPQWTIKQRLMAISLAACLLSLLGGICLLLRGVFFGKRLPIPTIVPDYIFRWTYMGVLFVYFCLIHYNSKQRIHALAQRFAAPSPETIVRTELDDPPKPEQSEFQSSQQSISRS